MGVGAGLYMYVVVVQKFTFAISSPDEFLSHNGDQINVGYLEHFTAATAIYTVYRNFVNSSVGPIHPPSHS